MSTSPDSASKNDLQESATGCLARLAWMMFGNVVLLACLMAITSGEAWVLTAADVIYWLTVAALVGIRYLDVTRLGGQTARGRPATLADWQRYSVALLVLAVAAWTVANLLAGSPEQPPEPGIADIQAAVPCYRGA